MDEMNHSPDAYSEDTRQRKMEFLRKEETIGESKDHDMTIEAPSASKVFVL